MDTERSQPDLEQPPTAEEAGPPLDGLTASVLAHLEQKAQERTWLKSAGLLGISLVIFALTGFFNHEPARLAMLIGVLLFHELGHYAGMRLFNYQDVRMFFIPLFGAAVAGKPRSVEGYKEAIVLLLGPLPGIVLGGVLGIAGIVNHSDMLNSLALLLIVVNGFNLLPFLPLDGGRLLHLVLFSRQPYLEAVFRVVTGGLVAYLGWLIGSWMLGVAGGFIVIGTGHVFRISRLAQVLRGPLQVGGEMDLSAQIPREQAVPLIELVRKRFPQVQQPKQLADTVRQVWERIHQRPPGLASSLLILLAYAGALLAAPVLGVALAMHESDGTELSAQVGEPAAPLAVEAWVNGPPLTDDDLKGKVVLLDFWAVWCGPCVAAVPHLREWQEQYGARGLVIIGVTSYYNFTWDAAAQAARRSPRAVTPAEEQEMLAKFAEQHQLNYRLAIESRGAMSNHYAVGAIPQVVVIDQQGIVRQVKIGSGHASAAAIGNMLEQLLPAGAAGGQ